MTNKSKEINGKSEGNGTLNLRKKLESGRELNVSDEMKKQMIKENEKRVRYKDMTHKRRKS